MTMPQAWRFDDLVREGVGLIPAHAPGWTDHNPSDPGITLVELLAYFTEMLGYRVGRVTPQAKLQFLRLLVGSPQAQAPDGDVDGAISRAVEDMSRSGCAVTASDFETLAVEAAQAELGPTHGVQARCLTGAEFARRGGRRTAKASSIGVVLLPRTELDVDEMARLCDAVGVAMAERCLVGTRVQVLPPVLLHLGVRIQLVPQPGFEHEAVRAAVGARLRAPGTSWGPAVRLNDITALIDNTEGVDHVEQIGFTSLSDDVERLGDAASGIGLQIALHSTPGVDARLGLPSAMNPQRLQRDDAGRLAAIALEPWELVRLHLEPEAAHG